MSSQKLFPHLNHCITPRIFPLSFSSSSSSCFSSSSSSSSSSFSSYSSSSSIFSFLLTNPYAILEYPPHSHPLLYTSLLAPRYLLCFPPLHSTWLSLSLLVVVKAVEMRMFAVGDMMF
ncbi:hypothetical protein E2C01_081674 [Portunus trituberculatus]|uniref:Uncharacterized protein n=1 Tax=Portunus trituberculatus TaxID=210409 RepID=A0A5B7J1S3_PORTR|nr:hypothetical protein [Portunus trituberculatus]